jgi:hypothetical protein
VYNNSVEEPRIKIMLVNNVITLLGEHNRRLMWFDEEGIHVNTNYARNEPSDLAATFVQMFEQSFQKLVRMNTILGMAKFDILTRKELLILCVCCIHNEKWFNLREDWLFSCSDILSKVFPDLFDMWWNTDYFDWEQCSGNLAKHCYMHFSRWWNPDKFNMGDLKSLQLWCNVNEKIWAVDIVKRELKP